ncbi:aldose 1-epimerase family protein [Demetria terragena]|uniref:aldose 1-epimerase family protein n=1 Tax=Demetria terragena TaxID=63959 RepID=UPI00036C9602|nr:aldose 1-epimerase family protein [Demetria terragena]
MSQSYAPSGEQWTIRYGDQHATIVQVGGGIREYVVGGKPVLFGYDASAKADAGRGQMLMPWPNRIRDGQYTFAGRDQQLALSEPARANASHGLVRWAIWTLESMEDSALTVTYSLLPQQGWDAALKLTMRYALGEDGLTVTPSATNVGDTAAPFGFGAHPYLTAGEPTVDEASLRLPAETLIRVDDRLIPNGSAPISPDLNFSALRSVGDVALDHAFTDLQPDDDGRWRVTIAYGGRVTTLWADASAYPYVQAFTGDSLPGGRSRATGIAVEPMTCPANAFATGDHLIVLEPGETWSAGWGVRAD